MPNDPFTKWRVSSVPEASENTRNTRDPFAKWRVSGAVNREIPTSEPEDSYLRMAAQVPRNIASGAVQLGDLANMAVNYGLRKAGVKHQFGYPSEAVAKGFDTLTGGYTTPQTKRERLAEAGTKAIADTLAQGATGTGIIGAGLKSTGALTKLGRGLTKINPTNPAALAATGAGATAGQAYHENHPGDLLGTLGTGLAADIATRGALGAFNPKTVANVLKINPENVEAFHRMGASPTLGQASEHPLIKSSENIIKNISPTSELRNVTSNQYEHMKDVLGRGARNNAMTEQEAGKAIKNSLKPYGKKASDLTKKLKADYMKKVNKAPTHMIDVTDSLHYFDQLEKELETETAKANLRSTPVGETYKRLHATALENKGLVPIRDLEEFRTELYDEISKGDMGKISSSRLTGIISKVNDDIKDYMEGIGAIKEWTRYNKFYSQWAESRKPLIISSKKTPASEAHKLFDSIGHSGKLDRSVLDTVYASQNKTAQKDTLDALIQKMGKNGNDFDLHLFAKRFANQPPETQNLALKPLSSPMKDKFKGVIHSIDKIKELAAYGNPSRTAYTNYAIEGAKIGALAGINVFTGNSPKDAFWQYALLAAGTSAISKGMFANPKFINWAYKGSKLKNPKAIEHHIGGIKGILGRPFYRELISSLEAEK